MSTTTVSNWDIASNLNDWTLCYNASYLDYDVATTSSNLTACSFGDDYYVFVGAVNNSWSEIYIGAYGPSSVLTTTTASTSTAYKPSWDDYPSYNVFWYNYPSKSFGFAQKSKIDLWFQADYHNFDNNERLSWELDTYSPGFRAGNLYLYTDLRNF